MSDLVAALPASTVDEAGLAGEWELVYADVELFRSSPFFLAIEVRPTSSVEHRAGAITAPCHGRHGAPATLSAPHLPTMCIPTIAGGAGQLARHPSPGPVARSDGPHPEVGPLLQAAPAAGETPLVSLQPAACSLQPAASPPAASQPAAP